MDNNDLVNKIFSDEMKEAIEWQLEEYNPDEDDKEITASMIQEEVYMVLLNKKSIFNV